MLLNPIPLVKALFSYEKSNPYFCLLLVLILVFVFQLVPVYGNFVLEISCSYLCIHICGTVFGIVLSLFLLGSVTVFGASCAFFIARYIFATRIRQVIKRYPTLDSATKAVTNDAEAHKNVAILRMSPTPAPLLSYAMGVSDISFENYALGTLGLLPHCLIDVAAGAGIGNAEQIFSGEHALPWWIKLLSLLLLIAFVLGTYLIYQKVHSRITRNYNANFIDLEAPVIDRRPGRRENLRRRSEVMNK